MTWKAAVQKKNPKVFIFCINKECKLESSGEMCVVGR